MKKLPEPELTQEEAVNQFCELLAEILVEQALFQKKEAYQPAEETVRMT